MHYILYRQKQLFVKSLQINTESQRTEKPTGNKKLDDHVSQLRTLIKLLK